MVSAPQRCASLYYVDESTDTLVLDEPEPISIRTSAPASSLDCANAYAMLITTHAPFLITEITQQLGDSVEKLLIIAGAIFHTST